MEGSKGGRVKTGGWQVVGESAKNRQLHEGTRMNKRPGEQLAAAQDTQLGGGGAHLRCAWKSMTNSACLSMCTWKGCGEDRAGAGEGELKGSGYCPIQPCLLLGPQPPHATLPSQNPAASPSGLASEGAHLRVGRPRPRRPHKLGQLGEVGGLGGVAHVGAPAHLWEQKQ